MGAPRMALSGVVFESTDANALAAFYRTLLGWDVGVDKPGWSTLREPGGSGKLSFSGDPAYVPPVWPAQPGQPQMQVHLDIQVEDLDEAGKYVIELGARLADFQPQEYVRVYFDPAGHPFCLWVMPPDISA